MSMHLSGTNRRSGPVRVAIATGLMIGPSVLLILAALHTPKLPPLVSGFVQPAPARAAVAGRPSGCLSLALPVDASVGNAGGDPYAFYEFTREDALAAMRRDAERCMNSAAGLP